MTEVAVRRARAEDRAAIVQTLVRAFDRDPIANFLLRRDRGRARAFETVFDVVFRRLTLPAGETWIADEGAGAALWTPPGKWKARNVWPDTIALIRAVGVSRLPGVALSVDEAQRKHPREPHWYLFAIGVDPAHQGRGVGSALLRAVLAQCDARGEPAYLEASTPENARLYERHGFAVLHDLRLGNDGPSARLMWRQARA
jgi:ribosomal protein S18 acetylase RimI-like enzyme